MLCKHNLGVYVCLRRTIHHDDGHRSSGDSGGSKEVVIMDPES